VTLGTVGTALSVTGLVLAGAGTYLWWTSRSTGEHLAIRPVVAPGQAGLAAAGSF
jgi:hypothetical protein